MNETSFLQRIPPSSFTPAVPRTASPSRGTNRNVTRYEGLDREPLLLDVVYSSLVSTIPTRA